MPEVVRPVAQWRAQAVRILVGFGATAAEAQIQADTLIEGELRGHPSHGLQRLPTLVSRIRNGVLTPNRKPSHQWISSSAVQVDGHGGFGPVAAHSAVQLIAERAGAEPNITATIANSGHIGMVGLYAEQLARTGLIGVVLSTSEPLIGAPGGTRAIVGSNPIGIGVPTDSEPFVLDMSTAQVSMGKVLHHRAVDRPLEKGWAVDATGRPTTDPQLAAALSAFGGGKGFGLALAFELLVGLLSRTGLGDEVKGTLDTEHRSTKGDLILAFEPEALAGPGWRERVGRYLDDVRATAGNAAPVLVPGDRARTSRERIGDNGISLSSTLSATLDDLSKDRATA